MSKGNFLMRFPVAAKIALHNAGATGGSPGSPTPPGSAPLSMISLRPQENALGNCHLTWRIWGRGFECRIIV